MISRIIFTVSWAQTSTSLFYIFKMENFRKALDRFSQCYDLFL